jgi:hypothetical protein
MKRLRHPIRAIREPFGTAGLIVACVALVAALGGTALAAAKLNSTQKKEVEKIAKKFAGKPGANGANGTNGSPGAKGDIGAAGVAGAAGTSVTITPLSAPNCNGQAGAKFTVGAQEAKACNGKDGQTGFTKTLPHEETETGTLSLTQEEGAVMFAQLSFPIPLAAGLDSSHVHLVTVTSGLSECPGTGAAPAAEPGNLCIYQESKSGLKTDGPHAEVFAEIFVPASGGPPLFGGIAGAGTTGAGVSFLGEGTGLRSFVGTWAVTAP